MIANKIREELLSLGIIDDKKVIEFFPTVRDRDDVAVLKCELSGVIFLDGGNHMAEKYYNEKSGTSYWNQTGRAEALLETKEDDDRRFSDFKHLVAGKKYCDVGCGLGGVLEKMSAVAGKVEGVELQSEIREYLNKIGFSVNDSIEKLTNDFEVISMFHVFEHIINPLNFLKELHSKLQVGGKIIIEVPHANDALIKTFNLDKFKAFTFWSEHLILHTRKSLETYLTAAGFKNIKVSGFQRYPISNHLYWLQSGKPGGQNVFTQFKNRDLEKTYANHLDAIDETDTIIAVAEK